MSTTPLKPMPSSALPQTQDTGTGRSRGNSEATRLLCMGTYLDGDFRSRVIEELVEHEERTVAPSLGMDAVAVLAHALRARTQEMQLAAVLLVLWGSFVAFSVQHVGPGGKGPLNVPWGVFYGVVCVLIWLGRAVSGRNTAVGVVDEQAPSSASPAGRRAAAGRYLRRVAWVSALVYWQLAVTRSAVVALVFPLLIAVAIGWHRQRVAAVFRGDLSAATFSRSPRASLPDVPRYRRIGAAIDREQYSPLVIYDPFRPFVGAGEAHGTWSLAIELRRKGAPDTPYPRESRQAQDPPYPDQPADPTRPSGLTSRDVLDLITPRLERLKQVSADTSRDRLRDMELQECVLLPPGFGRHEDLYRPEVVAGHIAGAVDEGAEARRLFLRIRVGAWDEQVIVTILVRVHTQGEMLVLEVIPHVLGPVRAEFRRGDTIAARADGGIVKNIVSALLTAPVASVATAVSVGRTASGVFRLWMSDPRALPPDGPAASVRELGTRPGVLLFQEMDVSRYIKTIQDRIVNGARQALKTAGYETGEFEQQVFNIAQGGVYIGGSMSGGAIASGDGSTATQSAGED
jgi:hypothetical protein